MESPAVLSMPAYASRFQTIVTELTWDGTDRQAVLKPNAQRFYVRFEEGQGSGTSVVFPSIGSALATPATLANLPKEYKFRDAPGVTTGGFIGAGIAASTIVITEDIFLE